MLPNISGYLDRLLPHYCPICDDEIMHKGLCPICWSQLTFLSHTGCQLCGRPLIQSLIPNPRCGACHQKPSRLRYRRAVLQYDEMSRKLILPLKYGDRLYLAPIMAEMMRAQFDKLITDHHLIMPIPLHFTRRLSRSFNQSAELARWLCTLSGRRAQLDLTSLYRGKATRRLGRYNAAKRQRILRGAFAIRRGHEPMIKDKAVLLIDDVMTTGQTFEVAAKALLKSGVSDVDGLSFARVL